MIFLNVNAESANKKSTDIKFTQTNFNFDNYYYRLGHCIAA